ncbi:5'-nucleotidase C-terminal domain-containing protein [bacterium]|nr:5'-nucleotidase C-terminal domain-containing protein [bacterium]
MVTSVSTPQKTTNASFFYINDMHAQVPKMEKIMSASQAFDTFTPSVKTDKLKFSSGDIALGEDKNLNKSAYEFENDIGIMASALGNHECDIDVETLSKLIKNSKFKMLAMNVDVQKGSPLDGAIKKSEIREINGDKYGVIGLAPFDLFTRVKDKTKQNDFKIKDINTTKKDLQAEIDNLKAQGVNKIVLLSHIGYVNDVDIANSVEGIDVILGGHSHDLIEGIQEGKNLFYSKKTGEPTIITQTGKDGNNFGILNVTFDENGVIKTAQNNVNPSNDFKKNMPFKFIIDKILGKPEVVGTIKSAPPAPVHQLIVENPHADFLADAMREETGADIAMINSANLRGGFEAGPVDTRDITGVTPFKNKMTVIKLNEKDMIDAIKFGGKSFASPDTKPGIIQVSGLRYTINKKGELLSCSYLDKKSGTEVPIDVKNPNTFKTYTVAIDDFCAKGKDGFTTLNQYDNALKVYDYDKDKMAADYIKKQNNSPITIKTDGRINIVD